MSRVSFFAGIFGLPLLAPLILVGCLTPRYVPSDSLASAVASTPSPELARDRIAASFVKHCSGNWNFDRLHQRGEATLYSWESDAGLFARTQIICMPGQRCAVIAQAFVAWPFPPQLGGKRVPTRIWGCGASTPDWTRLDSAE